MDEWLLSASADGTAKVWHFGAPGSAQAARVEPMVLQHGCFVNCAAFLPPGPMDAQAAQPRPRPPRAVTGAFDGAVRVWSFAGPKPEVARVLNRHEAPVQCLAVSLEGSRLATGDSAGVVHVWSSDGPGTAAVAPSVLAAARRSTEVAAASSPHQHRQGRAPALCVRPSRAGKGNRGTCPSSLIAVPAPSRPCPLPLVRMQRWKAPTGQFEWVASIADKLPQLADRPVDSVRFHPMGKRLLLSARGGVLISFDLRLMAVLRSFSGVVSTNAAVRPSRAGAHVRPSSHDQRPPAAPPLLSPCASGTECLLP